MKYGRILGAGAALVVAMSATFAQAKEQLQIGYVDGWSDSVATTFVAAEIIKQKLGYDVKPTALAAGIMWQAVAARKLDAMLSAWLPNTHGKYWEEYGNDVVDYGANFNDAKIGLIVPDYVKAKSIEDLKDDKSFDGKIFGIDAGAGVMLKTDQAIKDYGLSGYTLVASSGAGMTVALAHAIKANKSIAVTGWVPHWIFGTYNGEDKKPSLRFLDDPKGVYGGAEHVDSIGSKDLEGKAPEVVAFLKKFQWKDKAEIGGVMVAIQQGKTPEAAAKDWVAANPARVAEWTGQ
ncbi:glycine betaine ABC transporter substrate-binding protein [Pseudomonas typographi]|uniref:Glycine betaine ABC transporter substrate-binding protein n=1 Tax=Pseudomonas typographi TaxID=2715964 RepID=A0ABR7Z0B0_9PSED|nr:glycine betaine ABC transporter substrate-binding protein [Pseudomonas typographi]MBD1551426.1 glycine betaine ABC transporter substrate-binding protein [Pseudomonas typographi]MBD1586480.1 glycine betaine ABC transporter substrate-binding protein [Pseudomonas typographi]MBD1598808.1 glycine betaine ABC transporter substrate-binding protein [Pseudomonas typographi]